MNEIDWREKPMMSPLGGFLIQTRADPGNFEVVIARPEDGLAHFWRDNDSSTLPWRGPTFFGSGTYIGATVIESDFRAFSDNKLGNLEVLATRLDGRVDQYWRDNGGSYDWHGPLEIMNSAGGAPSMAYTGARVDGSHHGYSSFYATAPDRFAGFAYWDRFNGPGFIRWTNVGGTGSVKLDGGVALTLTTIGAASPAAGYKYTGPGGLVIVAGVSNTLGQLTLYVNGPTGGPKRGWIDQAVFGRDIFPELQGAFCGRPCLIQGDFSYEEKSNAPFGSRGHLGNLELVVPSRRGGFLHFARDCGIPRANPAPIGEGWSGPTAIPGVVYDEVSLIQSNFTNTDHGNLELIARRRSRPGFDFFWRGEDLIWRGPIPVGDEAATHSSSNPLGVALVDPGRFQPALAAALYELLPEYLHGLDAVTAHAVSLRAVAIDEQLAGFPQFVNYDQLSGFTPNQYWTGHYLIGALYYLAQIQHDSGDLHDAATTMTKRVKVFERLAESDPVNRLPDLGEALYQVISGHRDGLDPTAAMTLAHRAVAVSEQLALIRPPDSQQPVNYDQLSGFTPNQYWTGHYLIGALYYLAQIQHDSGDLHDAATTMTKRVKVFERLAESDPVNRLPDLGEALYQVISGHRDGLDPTAAMTLAHRAVAVSEQLALIRPPDSQQPVNYDQLSGFTPNQYWTGHYLIGALYYLAQIQHDSGDLHDAATTMTKRVKVFERLAESTVNRRPISAKPYSR
ncbi:hypothetical protein QA942_23300 [Streptomyces sp. B21-106]|uniref:tetratricopeptide repeat protein n=1 Tax=Streptomyces sp. B21-106 TaxID=3039418 RepID=UPI002FF415E6